MNISEIMVKLGLILVAGGFLIMPSEDILKGKFRKKAFICLGVMILGIVLIGVGCATNILYTP